MVVIVVYISKQTELRCLPLGISIYPTKHMAAKVYIRANTWSTREMTPSYIGMISQDENGALSSEH